MQTTLGTRHRTKTNKTKTWHRKLKRWETLIPPKKREWTLVLTKGKQFLLLIRLLLCYSYIYSLIFLELVLSTVIFWTELSCWHKSYSTKAMLLLGWSHCYKNSMAFITLWNIHISNDNGSFPDGDAGILLLMKGKLTIRNVKSSHLS
jgi:hypothetical protein